MFLPLACLQLKILAVVIVAMLEKPNQHFTCTCVATCASLREVTLIVWVL